MTDKQEAFATLLAKISTRGDTYAYFFDRLDEPTWLEPLSEAGFFKDPPGTEYLENGYIRFPMWPESRALVRLAATSEQDVLQLILDCPETDNPRVHGDFVDAALEISAQGASKLVPRLVDWLAQPYTLLLPQKAGSLMERLAQGGEIDASLTLARRLLQLSERERPGLGANDDIFGSRREVVPLFDSWDYKTILENNVPGFVRAVGVRGVALLCDQLEMALVVEGAGFGGPPTDASYIWRPSIADDEQNHDRDPHDFLVTAIRDASGLLVSEAGVSPSEIVDLLVSRDWHVFARLAMHLAKEWVDIDSGPAVDLMLNRDLFEAFEVSHEYDVLITQAFPRASKEEQDQWLAWLDEGPRDQLLYAERVASNTGVPPSPEDLDERADLWRRDRLTRVPDEYLSEGWKVRKLQLTESFGGPSDFPVTMGAFFGGDVSPIEKTEAMTLSTQQLAEQSKRIPDTTVRYSSPEEGYAGVLQALAEEQPEKMSSGLLDFIGTKPLYVRSILRGLETAAKNPAIGLKWEPIVSMSEWVMTQPREIEGGSGGNYADLDPGWVWTRSQIADVLEEGLRLRTIPLQLRERVWALLLGVIGDTDSSGTGGLDAATDSLNSIRGKAMHDIMFYANWVFEASGQQGDETRSRSFANLMPEVAGELDLRLDSSAEPSPAVRAVYGMRIRLLVFLDTEWTKSRIDRIFSTGDDEDFDPLGTAAWDSFVKYGNPGLSTMELVRPQYEKFVHSLSPTATELDEVDRGVANQIMTMYWHGRLGDDPSGDVLLRSLFERGSVLVRHRALEFLGRSLREVEADLGDDIKMRLQHLWEHRLDIVRSDPGADRAELEAFGWWMESPVLDADWRIRQLLEVLRLANGVDADSLVVSALTRMEESLLADALRCLILIIRADTDGWGVYGWKDSAYRLIQRGASSTVRTTVERASDAANLLIARGFHEFRSLVPLNGGQSPTEA